jgi:hypothetical protein
MDSKGSSPSPSKKSRTSAPRTLGGSSADAAGYAPEDSQSSAFAQAVRSFCLSLPALTTDYRTAQGAAWMALRRDQGVGPSGTGCARRAALRAKDVPGGRAYPALRLQVARLGEFLPDASFDRA